MKCEDCLAVIEDYFDGELEAHESGRVGSHLSACTGCAAALESLSAEQGLYLSYERELEVTPALWERVRAGVSRLEMSEAVEPPPAPPSRVRLPARLSAFFAALALRPAYASSLALLAAGVTIGALWYGKSPETRTGPVALSDAPARTAEVPAATRPGGGDPNPAAPNGGGIERVAGEDLEAASAAPPRLAHAPEATATLGRSGRQTPAPAGGAEVAPAAVAVAAAAAVVPEVDHLDQTELAEVIRPATFDDDDPVADAARLLDPEEKVVARHVERAQVLMRAFKNARGAAAGVAYEKNLSRRLLEENGALRLEAEAAGDKVTRRVLDTIQPFLLDIANMPDNPSRQEVRSIRERMRKTEIVAALQVY